MRKLIIRVIVTLLVAMLVTTNLEKQVLALEEWFPYTTSWNDNVTTTTFNNEDIRSAVDGSAFLDAPAGKYGFVKADGDHFVFSDTGKRIKFWGTSLTFGACFPTHENAEILAKQLAKCGFNAVRFHGMDGLNVPRGIIDSKTKKLSEDQLDKLDYLICQLKINGIYSDLNLHVIRNYSGVSSVVDSDKLPANSKTVTLFDDTLIGLEREYAKDLLTHENKYTKIKYCDEPAICFVEIANEDSLYRSWTSGVLFGEADKNNLTQYYIDELNKKWNQYLKNKYTTQSDLENAWQVNSSVEKELAQNGGAESEIKSPWNLEKHSVTASVSRDMVEKHDGNYSFKIDASEVVPSLPYYLQFKQLGIKVEKGKNYRVEFYSKADRGRDIWVGFGREVSPYNNYGLYNKASLTTEWKKYSFSFVANETTDDLTRLSLTLGSSAGKVWFDQVSFKEINEKALLQGESLEKGNISRLKWSERTDFSTQKFKDSVEFYYELEKDFYSTMVSYIHNDLSVKVPLNTTNYYSGQPDLIAQQEGDYMDAHNYWDHPAFPNLAWDRTDFKQNNLSVIRENLSNKSYFGDGFIDLLGLSATKGKPMVVSEWNNVFPNDYDYEGPNMVTAYASSQDWDGLFIYEYMGAEKEEMYKNSNSADYVYSWFDLAYNPGKKALMLQNAIAFYRGDVKPAQKEIIENYNNDFAKNSYTYTQSKDVLADDNKLPFAAFYNYRIRKQFDQAETSRLTDLLTTSEINNLKNEKIHVNDTGEVQWNGSKADKEYLSINTDKYQGLDGFIADLEIPLKNLTAKVNKDCALGLISLDDNNISTSNRMLLTVVGQQKNTDQVKTSANGFSNWGKAPVLMERVSGDISVVQDYREGTTYKVYSLNNKGERVVEKNLNVTVKTDTNKVTIEFEIGDDSLCYEVVANQIN